MLRRYVTPCPVEGRPKVPARQQRVRRAQVRLAGHVGFTAEFCATRGEAKKTFIGRSLQRSAAEFLSSCLACLVPGTTRMKIPDLTLINVNPDPDPGA